MGPTQIFDYGIPYNIFTGFWTATQSSYLLNGTFKGLSACNVAIYWDDKDPNLMHFRQDPLTATEDQLAATNMIADQLGLVADAKKLVSLQFDLKITGRAANSVPNSVVKNVGAETTPDCYIFQITSGDYVWYNNQYCATANDRLVIGPQLFKNNIQLLLSQRLTRVSYEVPEEYQYALKSP